MFALIGPEALARSLLILFVCCLLVVFRGSVLEKHHVFDETGRTCEVLFTDMHYFNRRISCLAFRPLLFEENQLVARSSGMTAVG